MKFSIPEISWHNRDPVLSVDFQPKSQPNEPLRLATGGTDSHVVIWYLSTSESGTVNLEVAADLTRHQKAVNVVRWSPNGLFLASGDDESIIFIWTQKTDKDSTPAMDQGEEQYKETWIIHKTLRGHMEDVLDLSWSMNSAQIASGSVDNKLIVWEVARARHSAILSDHKGFVQGVAWDPRGQLIATASTDRVFRTFDVITKKVVSRSSKSILPFPPTHPLHNVRSRLYHDDTLQTYFRRLSFSPDGLLIAVPAGKIEPEQSKLDVKPINAVYIYTRYSLKQPACILPCGDPALVCRWSPGLRARPPGPAPALPAPRRAVLAVATKRCLIFYDTQQKTPIAVISNIHYTRITDLTWSPDGRILVASSTDGFCSVVTFNHGELGEVMPLDMNTVISDVLNETNQQTENTSTENSEEDKNTKKSTESTSNRKNPKPSPKTVAKTPVKTEKSNAKSVKGNTKTPVKSSKIDANTKFKTPTEKSPKKQKNNAKEQKTPVKVDVMEDTAMQSWSDNSNNDIIKPKETVVAMETDEKKADIIEIEDTEDMKLVYDESQGMKSADSTMSPSEDKDKNRIEKKSEDTNKNRIEKKSPQDKQVSPKQGETPKNLDNSNFFKQAKVTDIKEPVAIPSAPSPKAPRRVSFVTLSSPKNAKKK